MAFNKNSSKRLCFIAGIQRESSDIIEEINNIAESYIKNIIKKTQYICFLSNKKTILISDICFLSQIDDTIPKIIYSDKLGSFIKTRMKKNDIIDVIEGNKGYNVFTVKNSFNIIVKKILDENNSSIKLGKNVLILIQNLTEQYIIKLLNISFNIMKRNNRHTVLLKDIELANLILNI